MRDGELDECVNCGAGLLSVSDICPQCGWLKNKPIEIEETLENDIEINQDTIGSTKIKKKIFQPTGVRLLGIFHIALGVFLVGFAILFASAVMLSVMSTAMGSLAGIGSIGNMAMLPGMDSIDPATLSMISGMPSTSVMSIDEMMLIMGATATNASVVIILGIFAVIIGRSLMKGKKWARILIIVSSVISIPIAALLLGNLDSVTILGSIALDGLVIFYMTKPKVREYFNQGSIKKSEIKTDEPESKIKQTTETSSVPNTPSETEGLNSSSTKVRPLGVMILVILQVVSGTYLIVGAADIMEIMAWRNDLIDSIGGGSSGFSMFTMSTIFFQIISTIFITLGIASFVMALGLFKAKSWAWTLTCFFTIITLVLGVISMNIVVIIFDVILLYYLYRQNVKDYFGKSAQQF